MTHNQSISDGVQPWILTAMRYAIQKAVAAEREACAVIAEDEYVPIFTSCGQTGDDGPLLKQNIADAIRKRAIKTEAKEPA